MPVNSSWLERTNETAIEPELPVCDPHHHLWDHPKSRYLLDELLEDTGSGHDVRETVFLECSSMYRKDGPQEMKPVGETEFAQGIAAQSASGQYGPTIAAAGIVSFADLMLGTQVASVLEAHLAASPNRFRGIRNSCSWDESPAIRVSHSNPPRELYLNSRFREGFAALRQYDLTFDAWLFHPQIPELVSLARAFPETTIICDHFAGPLGIGPYAGKREEVFQYWKEGIRELATCPNVVVKLGGLVMAFPIRIRLVSYI
jgi:predicted TIM-barrel fold metal-dependent hydrolase